MPVYRDEKNNTWKVYYRYTDWDGTTHQSTKRGFKTKRDAQAWEHEQHSKSSGNLDMTFRSFAEQYTEDMKSRAKENTCNGVQREHNKKLNNGLPILHKVPPKRDYGRYFCILAEKGGTSHGA